MAKHFINARETIVTEALDGLVAGSGGRLVRLDGYPEIKVVLRADRDPGKVAVVSGGGAGHEPAHAGFVGRGMLTAAVSGEIFASPSVAAALAGIRAATGPAGCLLIVKNYTGDRLNFGLAAERARAEGLAVEMVIVADDIALPDLPQPRGVAGTLFVHKIAGHLAEAGAPLAEVAAAARAAAADIRSLGVSLSACAIPGQPFEARMGEDEAELGLGIHGEPGVERIALREIDAIVGVMAERLAARLPAGAADHALIVNNLGAVPPVEMGVIAHDVLRSAIGPRVGLLLGPGHYMTALNMNGFSLSLMRLDAARAEALASPVEPAAWTGVRAPGAVATLPVAGGVRDAAPASGHAGLEAMLAAVCKRLVAMEAELNRLDARAGDGDTGSTVAAGARSVLAALPTLPLADPAAACARIGEILSSSMGGSSGVLLSIFFTATGQRLGAGDAAPAALAEGLARVRLYGGAGQGDRTAVDALAPALEALATGGTEAAARAARAGAEATAGMTRARAGRAAYILAGDLAGVPDPGAMAVAAAFEAVAAQG
ncbi:dihydroxyacetone kinase subunit DhaK [Amaricoccus sp.]|uniref:dihydroxyacetone kinase subunit DhaK n=1 Tax=Amaricoccus sp. TaxID=1872485 RepID=UPI001B4740E1|nr:dihydroxyacetone kinase subunit DhaK [Amaricoccus sp.]MBP7001435.1 dihydroxyacetone kinase subunit DhaK [Amaricoccus sp.]